MVRNELYENLLDSLYAVDGVNAEFLADLSRPIPFAPKGEGEVILARFPVVVVREYQEAIKWHEEAIEEELSHADEGFISDSAAQYIAGLRADIALLRDRLKKM